MHECLFEQTYPVPYHLRYLSKPANFNYQILNFDYPTPHIHKEFWEFTILTEGQINNYINNEKQVCSKNCLFFVTSQDTHYILKKGTSPIKYMNVIVKDRYIEPLINSLSPTFMDTLKNGKRYFTIPDDMTQRIANILHKLSMVSFMSHELPDDILCSALMIILQHIFSANIKPFEEKTEWQIQLSKITLTPEFLTYSVEDLCSKLNYSKSHLNRIFKETFNMSPLEYLIEHKFRHARNVLLSTSDKIIDIATNIGYKNLSQFNVTFKKKFGVTPSEYRKMHKGVL